MSTTTAPFLASSAAHKEEQEVASLYTQEATQPSSGDSSGSSEALSSTDLMTSTPAVLIEPDLETAAAKTPATATPNKATSIIPPATQSTSIIPPPPPEQRISLNSAVIMQETEKLQNSKPTLAVTSSGPIPIGQIARRETSMEEEEPEPTQSIPVAQEQQQASDSQEESHEQQESQQPKPSSEEAVPDHGNGADEQVQKQVTGQLMEIVQKLPDLPDDPEPDNNATETNTTAPVAPSEILQQAIQETTRPTTPPPSVLKKPTDTTPATDPETPAAAPEAATGVLPRIRKITKRQFSNNSLLSKNSSHSASSSAKRRQMAPQPPNTTSGDQRSVRTPPRTRKRRVRFSHVGIRNYKTTIGDNPCCSYGPPLSLDWEYCEEDDDGYYLGRVPIDYFEASKPYASCGGIKGRRKASMLVLNATQRCARLFQAGYSMEDMKNAADNLQRDKFRGAGMENPFYLVQEIWLFHIKPIVMRRYNKNQDELLQRKMERELRKIERKVREEHESQSMGFSQQSVSMMAIDKDGEDDIESTSDPEMGIVVDLDEAVKMDLEAANKQNNNISMMNMSNSHSNSHSHNSISHSNFGSHPSVGLQSGSNSNIQIVIENLDGLSRASKHSASKPASRYSASSLGLLDSMNTSSNDDHDNDNPMTDESRSSTSSSYGIEVDPKQHDKATEIKLMSLRRPHMRAFHASWFSFFVAFFLWFSITPLLSEVKITLGLSNDQVWISSLMGAAGTVIMRIVMGPLCDTFGARLCMATILITAAIPTALTGLVQTSVGLSMVRLFIGFGGSSFVACQYWTSDMFARNVAGAANALAAGWGNLGGGIANLFVGSVLFPLLRFIYSGMDDDEFDDVAEDELTQKASTELAWRTVFIFPAVLAMTTGCLIIFYCDDSPLGSYRERIKSERLVVAPPIESLCVTSKNWNVWILAVQYACCFGIEVTMTNATALYFKDEFGQSTEAAAAIASIFGLMNIFARGVGGWCSDYLMRTAGVRGRLAWQVFTLAVEGVMVCVFAYAESLAGAIIALVSLSCMVQSAEGSTFGIVPYVERRFTGSVVGIVGSGGTVGSMIFSIFFVYMPYQSAFFFMGLCAVASSFLTLLLNTRRIAKMAETLAMEVEPEDDPDDYDEDDVEDEEGPQLSSQRETLASDFDDDDDPIEIDDADEPQQVVQVEALAADTDDCIGEEKQTLASK